MLLTVQERFTCVLLLPAEGDILRARKVRELRELLGDFSEEEEKRLMFRDSVECPACKSTIYVPRDQVGAPTCADCNAEMIGTGMIAWNSVVDQNTEVPLTPQQTAMIIQKLEDLNARSQLDFQAGQDRLYEKFVEGEDAKAD